MIQAGKMVLGGSLSSSEDFSSLWELSVKTASSGRSSSRHEDLKAHDILEHDESPAFCMSGDNEQDPETNRSRESSSSSSSSGFKNPSSRSSILSSSCVSFGSFSRLTPKTSRHSGSSQSSQEFSVAQAAESKQSGGTNYTAYCSAYESSQTAGKERELLPVALDFCDGTNNSPSNRKCNTPEVAEINAGELPEHPDRNKLFGKENCENSSEKQVDVAMGILKELVAETKSPFAIQEGYDRDFLQKLYAYEAKLKSLQTFLEGEQKRHGVEEPADNHVEETKETHQREDENCNNKENRLEVQHQLEVFDQQKKAFHHDMLRLLRWRIEMYPSGYKLGDMWAESESARGDYYDAEVVLTDKNLDSEASRCVGLRAAGKAIQSPCKMEKREEYKGVNLRELCQHVPFLANHGDFKKFFGPAKVPSLLGLVKTFHKKVLLRTDLPDKKGMQYWLGKLEEGHWVPEKESENKNRHSGRRDDAYFCFRVSPETNALFLVRRSGSEIIGDSNQAAGLRF